MTLIDPRAIVDPTARLADDVQVGPWSIIGPNVEIGEGTVIASHVVIKGPTAIGRHNRIFQFSSVGEETPERAVERAGLEQHAAAGAFLDVPDDAVSVTWPRSQREQDQKDVALQRQEVSGVWTRHARDNTSTKDKLSRDDVK